MEIMILLWDCGIAKLYTLWNCGNVVLWKCGIVVLHYGIVEMCFVDLWNCGTVELRNYDHPVHVSTYVVSEQENRPEPLFLFLFEEIFGFFLLDDTWYLFTGKK